MGEVVHNKLIRDKVPEIIRTHGATAVTRVLTEEEYRRALLDKLIEEATELRDDNGSLGERVDVEEVLRAIDHTFGYDAETIEATRADKAAARGGFEQRIYLEKTVE